MPHYCGYGNSHEMPILQRQKHIPQAHMANRGVRLQGMRERNRISAQMRFERRTDQGDFRDEEEKTGWTLMQ